MENTTSTGYFIEGKQGLYQTLNAVRELEARLFTAGFILQEGNTLNYLKKEVAEAWERELSPEESEAMRRGFSEGVFRALMATGASDLKQYLKPGCFRVYNPIVEPDGIGRGVVRSGGGRGFFGRASHM